YLIYQARRADGSIILRSPDAPETPLSTPLSIGFHDAKTARFYTAANKELTVFVQAADRLSNRREAVLESLAAMLIPLLLLVPGSYLAIWLIVRRAAQPMDRLRDAIATKDTGHLAPITVSGLPVELEPIVRSVNLLLERLRTARDAESAFTSNSAHELRTPIAGALVHCQILIRELSEGPARDRARLLE